MRCQEYIKSPEFRKAMQIIRRHGIINQESLKYETQQIQGLSEGRFRNVCEAVFETRVHKVKRVYESSFPEFHVEYEGINFHLIIGQGSTYWTKTSSA